MAMTLLGVGVGPLLIGMLSDGFAHTLGNEGLRYALASCISLLVLASVFLAMALPRYRNHLMNKTPTPAPLADAATA